MKLCLAKIVMNIYSLIVKEKPTRACSRPAATPVVPLQSFSRFCFLSFVLHSAYHRSLPLSLSLSLSLSLFHCISFRESVTRLSGFMKIYFRGREKPSDYFASLSSNFCDYACILFCATSSRQQTLPSSFRLSCSCHSFRESVKRLRAKRKSGKSGR